MVAPYVPDANYGGEGGPGFDYAAVQPQARQPLSTAGVTQHAYNPDQTNGIGYQLANSGRDAYKHMTAYSNAIGQGYDEETAKRHAYDANGYANYNYDGTDRSSYNQNQVAPTAERAEAANQADYASRYLQGQNQQAFENARSQNPTPAAPTLPQGTASYGGNAGGGNYGPQRPPAQMQQQSGQQYGRPRPQQAPNPFGRPGGIGGTNPSLGPSGFGTQPQQGLNRTNPFRRPTMNRGF